MEFDKVPCAEDFEGSSNRQGECPLHIYPHQKWIEYSWLGNHACEGHSADYRTPTASTTCTTGPAGCSSMPKLDNYSADRSLS